MAIDFEQMAANIEAIRFDLNKLIDKKPEPLDRWVQAKEAAELVGKKPKTFLEHTRKGIYKKHVKGWKVSELLAP